MNKAQTEDMITALEKIGNLCDKYGLDEISVEADGFKAKLVKKGARPPMPPMPQFQPMNMPMASQPVMQQINGDVQVNAPAEKSGNIITSPIVGTYYSAPTPEKPPFVKVGDTVSKGQVVAIIESMKLMNEITSDFDGTVAEIMLTAGTPVEFGQPLMRIQ